MCKGTGAFNTERALKVIASTKELLESISPDLFRGTILSLEAVHVELSQA